MSNEYGYINLKGNFCILDNLAKDQYPADEFKSVGWASQWSLREDWLRDGRALEHQVRTDMDRAAKEDKEMK